jgi:hypothetical protein
MLQCYLVVDSKRSRYEVPTAACGMWRLVVVCGCKPSVGPLSCLMCGGVITGSSLAVWHITLVVFCCCRFQSRYSLIPFAACCRFFNVSSLLLTCLVFIVVVAFLLVTRFVFIATHTYVPHYSIIRTVSNAVVLDYSCVLYCRVGRLAMVTLYMPTPLTSQRDSVTCDDLD